MEKHDIMDWVIKEHVWLGNKQGEQSIYFRYMDVIKI